jgi:ABC-type polysaccharide/polyol phosphate export permease
VNPLTYEVEGLRGFLLGGGHPGIDLLVTLGWLIALTAAATRAYPKAIL